MKSSFYITWITVSVVIAGCTFVGLSLLSAMALNPTGYVKPTPWGFLLGSAAGLVLYWSVLCWAVGLLRKKPLWSAGLVAAGLALAYGYPAYDAKSYASQRAQVASHAIVGEKPAFAGKTAVLLLGVSDDCTYYCWNLARHMEARVVLLKLQDLQNANFNEPVDILRLPLYELDPQTDDGKVHLVRERPETIDYALIHATSTPDFDDAFERFRPRGIARSGLHIDALIVPTRDGRHVDLVNDEPVLRLMNVSRRLASSPWLPGAGRNLYWNAQDQRANNEVALDYFCTSRAQDDWHWCQNAFD